MIRSRTLAVAMLLTSAAGADDVVVTMHSLTDQGAGPSIGTVTISMNEYGTLFTPDLAGLPSGVHGFHVHQNPNCGPADKDGKPVAGLAAGGHYDPAGTDRHAGPYGDGHLGDLPVLYVDANGKATSPVLAPRVLIGDVQGRALVIHRGGDNYSDEPKPLGGGGARIACGTAVW